MAGGSLTLPDENADAADGRTRLPAPRALSHTARMDRDDSTPPAFGKDRVTRIEGGVIIDSIHPKEWTPRVHTERTGRAHPGTAVEWNDQLWEVVGVRRRSRGGYRHYLVPWQDDHAVRLRSFYDEESERARAENRRRAAASRKFRKAWAVAGVLTGHLPGDVQKRMAEEHGVSPTMATYVSLAPLWCIGVVCVVFFIPSLLGAPLPFPSWMLAPGFYWFLESAIRFSWTMTTGEPMGTLPGAVLWLVYSGVRRLVPSRSRTTAT